MQQQVQNKCKTNCKIQKRYFLIWDQQRDHWFNFDQPTRLRCWDSRWIMTSLVRIFTISNPSSHLVYLLYLLYTYNSHSWSFCSKFAFYVLHFAFYFCNLQNTKINYNLFCTCVVFVFASEFTSCYKENSNIYINLFFQCIKFYFRHKFIIVQK